MALGAPKKKTLGSKRRGVQVSRRALNPPPPTPRLLIGREVLDRRKNHLFVGFEADDDGSSGSKLSYPAATASKSCARACLRAVLKSHATLFCCPSNKQLARLFRARATILETPMLWWIVSRGDEAVSHVSCDWLWIWTSNSTTLFQHVIESPFFFHALLNIARYFRCNAHGRISSR